MANEYFDKHHQRLEGALEAIATRGYWSAFPEVPSGKIYGETAKADGAEAFKNRLGAPWAVEQPATNALIGGETSPYGMDIGITYPSPELDGLMSAAQSAMDGWKRATVEARVGACMEMHGVIPIHVP